jgi:hypothetical protein
LCSLFSSGHAGEGIHIIEGKHSALYMPAAVVGIQTSLENKELRTRTYLEEKEL